MAKLDNTQWREMMTYLRKKHPSICRQWFEDLTPITLDSGLLQIQTTTPLQQNYLQKRCLDQFTEAAQAITGNLVAVRFVDRPATPKTPPAPTGPTTVNTGVRPVLQNGQTSLEADQMVISPDYSFENFITGPNNQLAYAASVAVANQPGTAYNPLFIHGGVGLGKTHLLQAICQQILSANPDTNILYVSCDAFMNQFLECVQSGQMNEFRHRYRHVDVLVIDDIHFLAKRDRTQEEFFHTFNELYQSNKQIVLSSDAAPSEIPDLEDRLVSRFQWGLVTQVTKPGFETRVAILKAKARLRGIELPEDVINYIASKIDSNARELEGAFTTVQGHAALQDQPITLKLAQTALGDTLAASGPKSNQVTLQNIIDVVTEFYNVRLSDLQSRRRHKSVTEPRQVCMFLARKRTRFSLEEIGGYFGGRDHTTVMHSIRTIDDRMKKDENFGIQVNQLDAQIGNAPAHPTTPPLAERV
ncbi:Chromosomal replication initiator protein DnaA [Poriferisphaera corsica]|uniref:Chromosomal replication initiator protein DnaA n=1 Tax=Poriferisphaera corsica TaxID=2528020 RepID=A0A517YP32_9BACT|nr:chromosomal replication initiator protein DnaA [Poriferisphaera corsica]QDU31973.1 Chromosomal replication initiator protein DnaA [Poriferisphaera corsica]